jgi:hypothetical protein
MRGGEWYVANAGINCRSRSAFAVAPRPKEINQQDDHRHERQQVNCLCAVKDKDSQEIENQQDKSNNPGQIEFLDSLSGTRVSLFQLQSEAFPVVDAGA